ncbi:MAG: EF-hand domain-containing protein [Cyanobacteria bacterium P01_A01_bin.70]
MSPDYLNNCVPKAARHLPEHRLEVAKADFASIDLNKDCKIELEEFLAFALAKEIKRLMSRFQSIDSDKDGVIEFEEFLAVSVPHYVLLKKFAEFDANDNGLLSTKEVFEIIDKLVIPLDRSELTAELKKIDRDQDGLVSYEELLGVVVHHGLQ